MSTPLAPRWASPPPIACSVEERGDRPASVSARATCTLAMAPSSRASSSCSRSCATSLPPPPPFAARYSLAFCAEVSSALRATLRVSGGASRGAGLTRGTPCMLEKQTDMLQLLRQLCLAGPRKSRPHSSGPDDH